MTSRKNDSNRTGIEPDIKFTELVYQDGQRYLLFKSPASEVKVSVPLQETDKVPASGIFLGENILPVVDKPKFKRVLGIGSGKYAPAEFCMVSLWDAEIVHGVEANPAEAKFANSLAERNHPSDRVIIYPGSTFEPIKAKDYDLILSNIAQMPLAPHASPSMHDHGGEDGWLFLDPLIKQAPGFLKAGGLLSLLAFDFLGVLERTNPNKPSLVEKLQESRLEIVHQALYRRKIRQGGETHKSMTYILDLYPQARFYDQSGLLVPSPGISKLLDKGYSIYLDFFVVTSQLQSSPNN